MRIFSVILALPTLLGPISAFGQLPQVGIGEFRPSQFTIGFSEVDRQEEDLQELIEAIGDAEKDKDKKAAQKELDKSLEKNAIEVIRGPQGYYILDGHHFARAALNAGLTALPIKLVADWSYLGEADFLAFMTQQGLLFLWDENGNLRTAAELESHLKDMKDDPYRSLASWLKRKGAFFKLLGLRFQECIWAHFLRSRPELALSGTGPDAWKEIRDIALEVSRSAAAQHLPGFNGKLECATALVKRSSRPL